MMLFDTYNFVFYHDADNDGKFSAAVACLKAKREGDYSYNLFPINYTTKDDCLNYIYTCINKHIRCGESCRLVNIYFLDFCPDWEVVGKLSNVAKINADYIKIYIIDHHLSARQAWESGGYRYTQHEDVEYIYDNKLSGCQLTWRFFNKDKPEPLAITLIGMYDTWKHEDDNIIYFEYGIRLRSDKYEVSSHIIADTSAWNDLLDPYRSMALINSIIEEGKIVFKYIHNNAVTYFKAAGYQHKTKHGSEVEFLNLAAAGSFNFPAPKRAKLLVSYAYDIVNKKWNVGLKTEYSSEVNCMQLAQHFGGGGHVGAAGCSVTDLHDLINYIDEHV